MPSRFGNTRRKSKVDWDMMLACLPFKPLVKTILKPELHLPYTPFAPMHFCSIGANGDEGKHKSGLSFKTPKYAKSNSGILRQVLMPIQNLNISSQDIHTKNWKI